VGEKIREQLLLYNRGKHRVLLSLSVFNRRAQKIYALQLHVECIHDLCSLRSHILSYLIVL
jgi:hypothetical protein